MIMYKFRDERCFYLDRIIIGEIEERLAESFANLLVILGGKVRPRSGA